MQVVPLGDLARFLRVYPEKGEPIVSMKSIEQNDVPTQGGGMMLPRRVGRYDLLEEIGRGATSRVYRALDTERGGVVAVKVSHLESIAGDFQHRLRNEHEIQKGVGHQNIVRLVDWFELGDEFFLVMEYVAGQSLWQLIHGDSERLPFERARGYLLQMIAGVEHLHDLGIVHRDIKPGNILVSSDGRIKLADFGIAKYDWQPGGTATRLGIGTPEYMSPEQASGGEVDRRSDLYSIGITFYEMLAGRSPFARQDLSPKGFMEVVSDLLTSPLPDPRTFAPQISEETVDFLRRATAKDPAHRFQSCAEMRAALLGIGSGDRIATIALAETVVAAGRSLPRSVAVLIGVLLLGGISWALVSSNREEGGTEGVPPGEALSISGEMARRYSSGWQQRKADSLALLYRPTGARYLDNESATPATMRSIVAQEFESVRSLDSFTLLPGDVRSISPSSVTADWTVIRDYHPAERTRVRDTILYTVDLEKFDGSWTIASQQIIRHGADTLISPAPKATRPATTSTTARTSAAAVRRSPPAREVVVSRTPAARPKAVGKGKAKHAKKKK